MNHAPFTQMIRRGFLVPIVIIVLTTVFFGCQSTDPDKAELAAKLKNFPRTPPKVVLGPGDEVEVKFYTTPELDELQTVRPDGMITLQLVGDVKAEGTTPAALSDHLKELFAKRLQKPEVSVIVRSLVNRRVFIGGEVNEPGMVEMPARLTALEAIMQAGGFNYETAEFGSVVVIRHKDGKRYGCKLDFDEALNGEVYEPLFLEPHDIVYVPQSTIYKVTLWIDQHINRIIPLGFTLTDERGDTTIGFSKNGVVGGVR